MPKIVEVDITGISPYSQSRQHDTPKKDKETAAAYEMRTWREKCSCDESGNVVIPAMAFKQALDAVAKRLGDQIPGRGKATYTKHFLGGVLCEHDVALGFRKDDAPGITLSCDARGKRGTASGQSTRVKRTFPQWPKWSVTARFAILDDTVTREVFERHLNEAGRFIGIGRFRPENGGLNGRFKATAYRWSEI